MTDEEEKRRKESGEGGRTLLSPDWERKPHEVKVSHKLEEIAKEVGADHITAVAIAYVMHVGHFASSIVGLGVDISFYRKRLMCSRSWGDEKWNNCTATYRR